MKMCSVFRLMTLAVLPFVLMACAGGIPLRRSQVLTGLFDNKLEDMEAAFVKIKVGNTWEQVQELGFKEVKGVIRLEGPDALPDLCGRGTVIQLTDDREKMHECAQDFNRKIVRRWPYEDTGVGGKVGFINWQEKNTGENLFYLIVFHRGNDNIQRVIDKRSARGDPIGVKTKEIADFIIGGADKAMSGFGSEFGKDAYQQFSPFK